MPTFALELDTHDPGALCTQIQQISPLLVPVANCRAVSVPFLTKAAAEDARGMLTPLPLVNAITLVIDER